MPAVDSPFTVINSIPLVEQSSTPATPASGKSTVFVKADGLYVVDDAGTVTGPFVASAGPAYDASGWTAAGETWTYASADGPTGVFTVAADVTGKYSVGMRVKLTQTTVKYGIIVAAPAYSAPNTTITIYMGTDYTLASAAITSPYYSTAEYPLGFPPSPTKWSIEVVDTSDHTQASPTQNAWYNLGSLSISLHIGCWDLAYYVVLGVNRSGAYAANSVTLSTANNSESDAQLTGAQEVDGANSTIYLITSITRRKHITVSSKTSYYLNANTKYTGVGSIDFYGTNAPTIIRAVCAYL